MSERLIGECTEAGDDEQGRARLVIYCDRAVLAALAENVIYQEVEVLLARTPPPSPAPSNPGVNELLSCLGPDDTSPAPPEPVAGASDLVAELRKMAEVIAGSHYMKTYAMPIYAAATRIEELVRALAERSR